MFIANLHTHTEYSNLRLRDCINKLPDLIETAIKLGHQAIAITDHECVSSAVKIDALMDKYPNFKFIRGNEIYLCRNGLNGATWESGDKFYHFVLLAKDAIGFQQISELSTRAWQRSEMRYGQQRVPTYYTDLLEVIAPNPGHVIGMSACLGGWLPGAILSGEPTDSIHSWIASMQTVFGEQNFFLEMQPSANKEQIKVNKTMVELSNALGVPLVVTTDAHYLRPEDAPKHSIFLKAQNGDREVASFYATTYMMNTTEIQEFMEPCIGAEALNRAFRNIVGIVAACEQYKLSKPLEIPSLPWIPAPITIENIWHKRIPWLTKFTESPHESDRHLARAIIARVVKDPELQNTETYEAINDNLERTWLSSEVNNARWSSYLLNLQTIVAECWKAGTLVGAGRGSGAGFILLYLLDIVQINPLRESVKLYAFRFLNPSRVSPLDVDIDIERSKREQTINHLKQKFGYEHVVNVATFRTEKPRSALHTAMRGLNIDIDEAAYIASLLPIERGEVRSLQSAYHGGDGRAPVSAFVAAMNQYPEVWAAAQAFEGIICGYGQHAGGIIFTDKPVRQSCALMRSKTGVDLTAFELSDCESLGLIKMDLLSVAALDRIHAALDLLSNAGHIEWVGSLRDTYESVIGVYQIERDDPKMWEMIWEHKIISLFQMEQQSGIRGIDLIKPKSLNDLATLNSVIRLMNSDRGAEQPLEMWARYREDIKAWHDEMHKAGLSPDEVEWLATHPVITEGIAESQEALMVLVQEPKLGGHDLGFADKCRKVIAKKLGKQEFKELSDEFYASIREQGLSMPLARYVWDTLLRPQRGYSFNKAHTLSYSLIALQEMNLAYRFPLVYWHCANLIVDSGGGVIGELDE